MDTLRNISIIGRPFLACIGAVFAASVIATLHWHRHGWGVRCAAVACNLVMAALVALSGINAHFAYIPSIGALLGRRAQFQASGAQLSRAVSAAETGSRRLPDHGMVALMRIPAPASGFQARRAQVYLPRTWFQIPRPHLPVLLLLHGTPGTPLDWTRAGSVDVVAERWATLHGATAPIIVMPDSNGSFQADSECVNGRLGNVETYLTVDVLRWAIDRLGAAKHRSRWAIGGLSSGGTCALQLTLRHPALFSTFLAFGAEGRISHGRGLSYLFARSPAMAARAARRYSPTDLLASYRPDARLPIRGWIEAGRNDGATSREAVILNDVAHRHGLPTSLRLLTGGGHTFRVWRRSMADAYPWLMEQIADQPTDRPPAPRRSRSHVAEGPISSAGAPRSRAQSLSGSVIRKQPPLAVITSTVP